tara:strand:- start:11 stop:349 length:339 start_codon:yes stop_codon:yes gene_type:complete
LIANALRQAWGAASNLTRSLVLTLCALQIADADSTVRALKVGREEQNLLIVQLSGHVGIVPAVLVFKALAICLTAIYFVTLARRSEGLKKNVPLIAVTLCYCLIVFNNYSHR